MNVIETKTGPEGRRLKIAVLTSTYPRAGEDPAVPWMREMTRRTAASHSVTIIAPAYRGLGSHLIDGIPVRRFRYAPRAWETLTHDAGAPNMVRSPWFKLLAVPYLICGFLAVLAATRKARFDVIHVHWPFPHGLMALLPAWLFGARVVSTCHGAELAMARNSGAIRWLLGFCLKHSDAVCANSSHTAAEIVKVCRADVTVVPYGATVPECDAARLPAPAAGEPAMLLFCGRLIQRKGIDYLIRALPEILRRRPVRLVITGEGDRKREWLELARRAGVSGVVEFAGFVSNGELSRLYRECSVYVHPAIFDDKGDTEGLGVVLVEALANRKPVVASAVGGIVDVVVDGETGLLVPQKDEKALAAAILRVLEDPQLARDLGERGHAFAALHFDWKRINGAMNRIYAAAAAGRAEAATRSHGTPAGELS